MMKILILTTGGTIDKVYFDAKSKYEVGPPNAQRVLSELTISVSYRIESLMRKDSLDLTDADRFTLHTAIENARESRILITHGTDTMVETGKYLQKIKNKTIVLTGALEPAQFKTSDALFNIGCGLAAAQTLPAGVYVAMNGRVFDIKNVRKNLKKNCFEALSD